MKLRLCLATALLSLSSCTHLFYRPDHVLYYPPDKTGYKNQDIYFNSLDGTKLHAWFFHATTPGKPKGTLVHFHGNARNMSSMYMSLAWLTKRGYNLLSFDYRGYGDSSGTPSEEGTYKDGLAALDLGWRLHLENDPAGSKFVVYGHSLGGVVALRSFLDFRHQAGTSLVVMDSTFMSYRDLAQTMMASHWQTWVISPFARILVSDEFASKNVISRLKTPLLVTHDRHDPLVPFGQGEELYAAAPGKKFFWDKDDGVHAGLFTNEQNKDRFLGLLESL